MRIGDVVNSLKNNKKYKSIDTNFLNELVISLSYRYPDKQLLEYAKSKLHQIWGAYYTTRPDFNKLRRKYLEGTTKNEDLLKIHQSSKERLGEYEGIFSYIFSNTKHNTILDIGSGFNPIFISSLGDFEEYIGVDIDIEQQNFLSEILKKDKRINIKVGDSKYKEKRVDLTLALKLLPVLDQIDNNGAIDFLKNINSEYLVISFPKKSISGKEKNMSINYNEKYIPNIEKNDWILISDKDFLFEKIYIFRFNKDNYL